MDKINDLGGGMFAGAISSTLVGGILIPLTVLVLGTLLTFFLRRFLHSKFPPLKGKYDYTK